jgi:small basic protein
MISEDIKLHFSKTTSVLIQIGAVVAAISALAGGYVFYLNYVWKPKIQVTEVDFNNARAKLTMGSKIIELDGDALFLLGGDWGVRFGSTAINGTQVYDRIELIRKGMVYEYLKK